MMKKIFLILFAVIGFGISAVAQDCKDNISTEWKKDGQNGSSGSMGGYPAYVNVANNNNYNVTVAIEVIAVSAADGEKKTFSETFTIKANSNKTTTSGKYAIVNTKWYRGVKIEDSSIIVKSCRKS
ncbi:MAG: hypothetical protein LBJ63_06300 [Prevotellaceae bacterium]|jgi:hypothetical protein|nr:hypothetical protein [Prevotellaceae bacterium]